MQSASLRPAGSPPPSFEATTMGPVESHQDAATKPFASRRLEAGQTLGTPPMKPPREIEGPGPAVEPTRWNPPMPPPPTGRLVHLKLTTTGTVVLGDFMIGHYRMQIEVGRLNVAMVALRLGAVEGWRELET